MFFKEVMLHRGCQTTWDRQSWVSLLSCVFSLNVLFVDNQMRSVCWRLFYGESVSGRFVRADLQESLLNSIWFKLVEQVAGRSQ